ncbi:chromate efflux transporter [Nesterenkonia sp. E16_7]|uniref:chromate efflux transporter n=1 Tax=unclassified Nesterenkonia TaxID=2629769 RepID=UPI001A913E62|nr:MULTISPECIES: chromate efflux transporter [unclassified Nesterenkonia]MBO0595894.1 chromate efflux transporter [Nesterenkonia sp. E16_10]MBO0599507.1 chromate efflux transporter [Nesterenkonia sp. E16_7]
MTEHSADDAGPAASRHPGTVAEVFLVFLRLGLTSFGGPVAHLAYFRDAFVTRRQWLSEKAYADLVGLCQFLPGPASSQVGMALGLQRAGYPGMIAAWFAFTMPSVALLVAFALGVQHAGDLTEAGWIDGFKAAAVAVVAHAVLSMAKTLTPDAPRASIAAAAMVLVLLVPHPLIQVAAILIAGITGFLWLRGPEAGPRSEDAFTVRVSRRVAWTAATLFAGLLAGLPVLAATTGAGWTAMIDSFYRAGALVFGGGHVVLPLLQAETVPAMVDPEVFLAGYGAAQAVPGPLFTFAGFLGASNMGEPTGVLGAVLAVLAIFLPAALLVIAALPFWERLRGNVSAQKALAGVNAGVVGILAAALYTPVFTAGVLEVGIGALVLAVLAFVALNSWRAPAWSVVLAAGLLGWALL